MKERDLIMVVHGKCSPKTQQIQIRCKDKSPNNSYSSVEKSAKRNFWDIRRGNTYREIRQYTRNSAADKPVKYVKDWNG